jgi:hypothetical protein
LAGQGAKERREFGQQFLIFHDVVGDAPGVHGGVIVEFVPVVRAGLEAELFRPFAERFLVARRREDFALYFAPVAGVVAVLQTKLAQAEALSRSSFFNEGSKHRFNLSAW